LWHFDPIPGHGLYFTGLYNHCHLSAPHTVGLFWTSDQPDAETLLASTQRSQETDIRAPGRTWTISPSKSATGDLRLRQRGHSDLRSTASYWSKFYSMLFKIYL